MLVGEHVNLVKKNKEKSKSPPNKVVWRGAGDYLIFGFVSIP